MYASVHVNTHTHTLFASPTEESPEATDGRPNFETSATRFEGELSG